MKTKILKQFPNYAINYDGTVWSFKTNRYLQPSLNTKGYSTLSLMDKFGNKTMCMVHRLVAKAFKRLRKGQVVDHLDHCKTNNHGDNLRCTTHRVNSRAYYKWRKEQCN